jgi:hypothetical protein
MKTLNKLIVLLSLSANLVSAQVSINTDGAAPDASAICDIKSTNKGLLMPRMSINQRNSIANPAEGLIVFCTNCSLDGSGTLCVFTDGGWYTMNLCKVLTPAAGVAIFTNSYIQWNWNPVPGAIGYKWSTVNSFNSAVDMGASLSDTETGLNCGTSYTRYVWAYSDCGFSSPLILTQSTSSCFVCGTPLSVNHIAGNVAPVNKAVVYATVNNVPGETTKCWITSNLGATNQATCYNDATETSAGWYWQFNKMQGFKHNGTTRKPNTTWISYYYEYSNWTAENDPCAIELGDGWRVPTRLEWDHADASGNWGNWFSTYNSLLKLHAAGRLNSADGTLANRGSYGTYWSSTQSTEELGWRLNFNSGTCSVGAMEKPLGLSIRCIRD